MVPFLQHFESGTLILITLYFNLYFLTREFKYNDVTAKIISYKNLNDRYVIELFCPDFVPLEIVY